MTAKQAGFKVGDVVTCTINPTITITQYDRVRPFASINRTIKTGEEDLDVLRQQTVRQCLLNMEEELRLAVRFEGMPLARMQAVLKKKLRKEVENAEAEISRTRHPK